MIRLDNTGDEEENGVPVRDVIVFGLLAMEVTFNSVSAVVEHKDDGLDAGLHHDRQLLHRQLTKIM